MKRTEGFALKLEALASLLTAFSRDDDFFYTRILDYTVARTQISTGEMVHDILGHRKDELRSAQSMDDIVRLARRVHTMEYDGK